MSLRSPSIDTIPTVRYITGMNTGSESSREKIFQTALILFSQKGYDCVGVQEICTLCEITKPTLYYYFQSKIGLLESIIDFYSEKLLLLLNDAADYKHDFILHLSNLLKAQIHFAEENPEFFKLQIFLENSPIESPGFIAHQKLQNQIDSIYLVLFQKCTAEFGNMKGFENLYSKIFQSTVISTARAVLSKSIVFSEETAYRIIKSFVYGAAN